jgi:hypothetical protein
MEKTKFDTGMCCAVCKFMRPHPETGYECHRYPPVGQAFLALEDGGLKHKATIGAWPPIKLTEWCGEFSISMDKVQ